MKHSNNNKKFFFKITKNCNNFFHFYLINKEGYNLESDYYYTQKTNCLKGIKSVIRNSKNRERFIIEQPFDNAWRVYLKARNGKIIAISPCFDSEKEAKNLIENLKNLSLKTPVIDKTK